MALSNQQLQQRVEDIELAINELETAVNNLASRKQLISLLNIRQSEIDKLKERTTSLESQIKLLQTS